MPDWKSEVRTRLERSRLDAAREAEIVEELAQHLEDRYEELRLDGATEEEARHGALAELDEEGSLVRSLDQVERRAEPENGGRRGGVVTDAWRDVRYAARVLRRNPGFAAVAVVTLALGIGASTAIFSLVNGVLLRPLPYPEADRLVMLRQSYPQKRIDNWALSQANFATYRDHTTTFERVGAYYNVGFNLAGDGEPERLRGAGVTADLFAALGVEPALGRTFRAEENTPGKNVVCVLSHGFWRRRFGSDPGVVGRALSLNGATREVVGVMPEGFSFPTSGVDVWVPLGLDPLEREGHFLTAVGRLRPGVSAPEAQTEATALLVDDARRVDGPLPEGADMRAVVTPLTEVLTGKTRAPLFVLLGAVGLVLLIACANVATLLLARAGARTREIAVRVALGAGRGRVVRQLLAESMLLAALGAAAGAALAVWGVRMLSRLPVEGIPRIDEVSVNGTALAFAAGLTVMTGLLFGLTPAVRTARLGVEACLRRGGRGGSGASSRRLDALLVGAQFALSVVLLVGSGLMLKSFHHLSAVHPGFDPENVLTMRVSAPVAKYAEPADSHRLYESLLERVRALPGVRAAGMVSHLPFAGVYTGDSYVVEGHEPPRDAVSPNTHVRLVSPGFFPAFGMPVLSGRDFSDADRLDAAPVAIVDETFAREYWPDGDAVGKRVRFDWSDAWMTIVGVVPGVRHDALDAAPETHLYQPRAQEDAHHGGSERSTYLTIRTDADPTAVVPAIRSAFREIDPDLPIYAVRPMAEVVGRTLDDRRLMNMLLAAFAVLAAALAAVGIYGVMSSYVSGRTTEFGVRLALGARPGDLVRSVLGRAVGLAAAGAAAGTAGALALSRAIAGLLFDVSAVDPVVFALVPVALVAVGAAACFVPARRAARVDPLTALRHE